MRACCVDEHGERIFAPSADPRELPTSVFAHVFAAIIDVNGFDLAKNWQAEANGS